MVDDAHGEAATADATVHGATARKGAEPAGGRALRVRERARNARWRTAPFRIDMDTCINCDTCLRHCPPQFGAIFNFGLDVVILPELCSGCGKCLPPVCPVDCIVPDPQWEPSSGQWWALPFAADDPYV